MEKTLPILYTKQLPEGKGHLATCIDTDGSHVKVFTGESDPTDREACVIETCAKGEKLEWMDKPAEKELIFFQGFTTIKVIKNAKTFHSALAELADL